MTTEFQHDPQVNVYNTGGWINGFLDICHQMAQHAQQDSDTDRAYDMIHAQQELNRLRKEKNKWR